MWTHIIFLYASFMYLVQRTRRNQSLGSSSQAIEKLYCTAKTSYEGEWSNVRTKDTKFWRTTIRIAPRSDFNSGWHYVKWQRFCTLVCKKKLFEGTDNNFPCFTWHDFWRTSNTVSTQICVPCNKVLAFKTDNKGIRHKTHQLFFYFSIILQHKFCLNLMKFNAYHLSHILFTHNSRFYIMNITN
jgi:hypothetical protein